MITLKTSVAMIALLATAAVSAGATYFGVTSSMQATAIASCPPSALSPQAAQKGIPLGGPPLPTNQGQKW